MNRRNFLKLLGLTALPATLLHTPAQAEPEEKYLTDIRYMRIKTNFDQCFRVVIDNSNERDLGDFDGYFSAPPEQSFTVSEKSRVTVISPSGKNVTFNPRPDKVFGYHMQDVDIIGFDARTLAAVYEPRAVTGHYFQPIKARRRRYRKNCCGPV